MEKTVDTTDFVDVVHEANGNFDRAWRDEKWGRRSLSVTAQDTVRDEKSLTTWEAIKIYKKAICWSLVISTCVIMEGYDTKSVRPRPPSLASCARR